MSTRPEIPEDIHENIARMKSICDHHRRKLEQLEARKKHLLENKAKAEDKRDEFAADDYSMEAKVARRIVRKYEFDLDELRQELRQRAGRLRWAEGHVKFLELEAAVEDDMQEVVEEDEGFEAEA